jgi:hypothetical protein
LVLAGRVVQALIAVLLEVIQFSQAIPQVAVALERVVVLAVWAATEVLEVVQ